MDVEVEMGGGEGRGAGGGGGDDGREAHSDWMKDAAL